MLILEAKKEEPSRTPFKKDFAYSKYVHNHDRIGDMFAKYETAEQEIGKIKNEKTASPLRRKKPKSIHKSLTKQPLEVKGIIGLSERKIKLLHSPKIEIFPETHKNLTSPMETKTMPARHSKIVESFALPSIAMVKSDFKPDRSRGTQ